MDLHGKTLLVIGGTSRIGAAKILLCAQWNAKEILADRDVQAGKQIADRMGDPSLPVDGTNEAAVQMMANEIYRFSGKLDDLVQTAGILKGAFIPLEEYPSDMFLHVWDWDLLVGSHLPKTWLASQLSAPVIQGLFLEKIPWKGKATLVFAWLGMSYCPRGATSMEGVSSTLYYQFSN